MDSSSIQNKSHVQSVDVKARVEEIHPDRQSNLQPDEQVRVDAEYERVSQPRETPERPPARASFSDPIAREISRQLVSEQANAKLENQAKIELKPLTQSEAPARAKTTDGVSEEQKKAVSF